MRVAVIIPTTDGPAPILKLTRLAQAPRSVLRTQDDYRPLPPSSRYHAFIQPGGPLSERIGLGDGQFELRLGAPVETGRSWELPAALAHWIQSSGHHIDPERPELVVWATGALDNDLSVLSQDYHLPTKLERSAALLQSWLDRGVPVLLLLPEEVTRSSPTRDPRITELRVRDLSDAIAAIAGSQPKAPDTGPVSSAPRSASHRQLLLAGATVLLLTALFVPFTSLQPIGPVGEGGATDLANSDGERMAEEEILSAQVGVVEADPVLASTAAAPSEQARRSEDAELLSESEVAAAEPSPAVLPTLVLEQAPEGSSCRAVLFGETVPKRVEWIAVEGAFHAIADGDLCGFAFHLPETATYTAQIELSPAHIDLIIPSDRHVRFALTPGADRLFRLRAQLPARIEWAMSFTAPGYDLQQLQMVIEGIQ